MRRAPLGEFGIEPSVCGEDLFSAMEARFALTPANPFLGALCGVVSVEFGVRGREGLACGYAGDGSECQGDEDDGEDRDEKVGGHVTSLVIVVVCHVAEYVTRDRPTSLLTWLNCTVRKLD